MSFVSAVPELVNSAAGELASIGCTLDAATAAAAVPTAGIVAAASDEVSVAVASLFSTHGQDFQAVSARVSAIHGEFERLLTTSANAYLSAEAANVVQATATAAGLPSASGAYQRLFANTNANLQALGNAISADPAPLLNQFVANQQAYAQVLGAAIRNAVQNFPGNVIPAIQAAIQNLENFDPAAFLRLLINNQIGYAQTFGSALSNSAASFRAGVEALPASFQAAWQSLQAGDISGAVGDIGTGFLNLFIGGVDTSTSGPITDLTAVITPIGTLADLLPILTIPGQMAQDFTDLLPTGSVPALASQNLTNVINTVTDTSIVANAGITIRIFPPSVGLFADLHLGMPVALVVNALGVPVNGVLALQTSGAAVSSALGTGNWLGVAGALVEAPAVLADGLLNGVSSFPLTFEAGGYPVTVSVPLDGLLVEAKPYTASVTVTIGNFPITTTTLVGGTPLGGLLPALLTYVPQQLAHAIGAPA